MTSDTEGVVAVVQVLVQPSVWEKSEDKDPIRRTKMRLR
jgi:hypothetical protein